MSVLRFYTAFGDIDLKSRPKRRKATAHIVGMLECIRNEEEAYLERIPENFHGGEAYDAAESSVSMLNDAIDALSDAF